MHGYVSRGILNEKIKNATWERGRSNKKKIAMANASAPEMRLLENACFLGGQEDSISSCSFVRLTRVVSALDAR